MSFLKRSSGIFCFLLLIGGIVCFGCSRAVTGGFQDSADKKLRMYGRVFGPLGGAFLDNSYKTVRIDIVTGDAAQTLLFRKQIRVKGSDVGWDCAWDKDDNATIIIYDYGPNVFWSDAVKTGTPSNRLASVSLNFDKATGKIRKAK
jgi:hypothetical protein